MIKIAKKIMNKVLSIYGSRSNFIYTNEGGLMNKRDTYKTFYSYVANLQIKEKVDIIFKTGMLSRSSLSTYPNL